jgi:hypothetical protein
MEHLMKYDTYNREERYICAHLFRLLHEWAVSERLGHHFVAFLKKSGVDDTRAASHPTGIFFEVALIRDAYFSCKPRVDEFMDKIVGVVARQEELDTYTSFSDLADVLKDPSKTHPKQIRHKAASEGIHLSKEDSRLYGAIQGMFNAKPDLAVTVPGVIIAYEAKFTQAFESEQTSRTEKITQVWSEILYEDLGFKNPPSYFVSTIGPGKLKPDISWEWLLRVAGETFATDDRTYIALQNAVSLLS